jgi:hypothetical protein
MAPSEERKRQRGEEATPSILTRGVVLALIL